MKKILVILFLLVCNFSLRAQQQISNTDMPVGKEQLMLLKRASCARLPAHKGTSGTGIVFDTTKWTHRVDSTWGAGMVDTAKLNLFNEYWGQLDSFYSCFVGLPLYNWDSIVNAMRTEISAGVSRGRFAGMMAHFMNYVNDGHTHFYDAVVDYGSSVYPGFPVFRAQSGLFGACITTLNDTSAMVYTVDPGHPFGLEPGDIILGYNGIPWTQLLQIILKYQLPNAFFNASSNAATAHYYIEAAGENFYLFDTINIKKCDGSIVNYPTSLMSGTSYGDLCTEEMPVAGVHKLTYNDYYVRNRITCSGVIKGTRVGYVSLMDCSDNTGDSLYNAVKVLMEDSLVDGLILDIRTNYGGVFGAYFKTFMYLNEGMTDMSWLGIGDRLDPTNRLLMYNYPSTGYDVYDTIHNSFDKKIAILCGPGAISSGDVMSVLFKHDPYVKTFGKSSAGAYGGYYNMPLPYSGYYGSRQGGNFFQVSAPTSYLSHTSFPVDSNVWFSRTSVCAGKDTILNSAVQWIEADHAGVNNHTVIKPSVKIYPNPSAGQFNIVISSKVSETIHIRVCNVLGATIKTVNANLITGEQVIKMDLSDMHLGGGSYYLVLQGNGLGSMVKKITIID